MARNPAVVQRIAHSVGLTCWPAFLAAACSTAKLVYILGGWRGGKSARIAFIIFVRIILVYLQREGTALIWLVGPDYEQARPEYFYLQAWCTRLGMQVTASTANQGSLRMEIAAAGLPGVIEVVTKSATDPTSLGSVAPDEIAMCEAGQISEESDLWIDGRTAEKNANVVKGGTFENDEGKAQFFWFETQAAEALARPTARVEAFTCPTWENLFLYGDCRAMIADDPTLEAWCPDAQHGPLHSGLDHPMMRQLKDRWQDRPRDWRKRFGGEPQGVNNPVYEWAVDSPAFYLRSLPEELRSPEAWLTTAGGIDPGLIHPAALTVGSIAARGEHRGQTWVRSGVLDKGNTAQSMWKAKDYLEKRFGRMKWGGDPNGLQYTREYENIEAMRGSLYAREARVKVVNGVANDRMLFFNADDPYCVLLFSQIGRVHRRKDANGQLVYDRRTDDDMVASFEDMMAMLHGQPTLNLSPRHKLPAARRSYSLQRAPMTSVS